MLEEEILPAAQPGPANRLICATRTQQKQNIIIVEDALIGEKTMMRDTNFYNVLLSPTTTLPIE